MLKNAVQYTPNGGKIQILLEEVSYESDQSEVFCLRIKDNGYGIDPRVLKSIYEPFSNGDKTYLHETEGLGLGLPIVQNLVNMMNGDVQIQSEIDEGTEITVTLGLEIYSAYKSQKTLYGEKGRSMQTGEKAGRKVDLSSKRILLAEDNENHRIIMENVCKKLKLKVDMAKNGVEAVKCYSDHPTGYYHMILMDIQMPIMNGYEATKEIRRMEKKDSGIIPIVAMTENVYPEDISLSLSAGMNEHLGKPVNVEELKNLLIRWLV